MASNLNFGIQCQHIAANIDNNELCEFDKMLQVLLLRTSDVEDPECLLTNVLFAVLPICEELREPVIEYCNAPDTESGRCKPLINLINNALSKLSSLEKGASILRPYTFKCNSLSLMAHRTAEESYFGIHDCNSDVRDSDDAQTLRESKPSLIFTSLPAASRAANKISGMSLEACLVSDEPTNAPDQDFTWPDVLAAFELRCRETSESLALPPPSYNVTGKSTIPHIKDVSAKDVVATQLGHHDCDVGKRTSSTSGSSTTTYSSNTLPTLPPAIQAATYGARRMRCALTVTHAISFVVVDDVIGIWWYDRQGAIQTDGLNFVQDLPRFLALLFAFQRFDLEEWGFHPFLDPLPKQLHAFQTHASLNGRKSKVMLNNGIEVAVDLSGRSQRDYGLSGRFTEVFGVSEIQKHPSRLPSYTGSLDPKSYVTKIYWADMTRVSEQAIVERVEREAHHPDVKDHIPHMLGWKDDNAFSTNHIRDALATRPSSPSGSSRPAPPRSLRIIVFERLEKVQKLDGKGMMIALLQCVKCHYTLWCAGVRHNDLSVNNIMYRTVGDKVYGVVNDWDLATISESGHDDFHPTGTIPYIPLDLLKDEYWTQHPVRIKRLYRHDNESLIWVMADLFLRYEKGKCIPHREADEWRTSDWATCRRAKKDFASRADEVACVTPWEAEWVATQGLVSWMGTRYDQLSKKPTSIWVKTPARAEEVDRPEEVLRTFWEKLWSVTQQPGFPGELGYLIDEIPPQYHVVKNEDDS